MIGEIDLSLGADLTRRNETDPNAFAAQLLSDGPLCRQPREDADRGPTDWLEGFWNLM
jgi:hypothetical protein